MSNSDDENLTESDDIMDVTGYYDTMFTVKGILTDYLGDTHFGTSYEEGFTDNNCGFYVLSLESPIKCKRGFDNGKDDPDSFIIKNKVYMIDFPDNNIDLSDYLYNSVSVKGNFSVVVDGLGGADNSGVYIDSGEIYVSPYDFTISNN